MSIEVPSRPEAAREARSLLRSRLHNRLPPAVLVELSTVVTELVNNSVQHGPGEPIQIRIALNDDGSVRGEVEDQGDGVVAIRETDDDLGGLGLRMVEALTFQWAVYEGSTHVWFEMGPRPVAAGGAPDDPPRLRHVRVIDDFRRMRSAGAAGGIALLASAVLIIAAIVWLVSALIGGGF